MPFLGWLLSDAEAGSTGCRLEHPSSTYHPTGEQIPQKLEHGQNCAQENIPAESQSKERLHWYAHLCAGVLFPLHMWLWCSSSPHVPRVTM